MMSPNSRATLDIASAEDHGLRAAWAAAALREYRCHARYISLLALEAAGELELRFAWLEWWDATCVCREALLRLEAAQI
jgi:hypothetical protein